MAVNDRGLDSLFHEALGINGRHERERFLRRSCGSNVHLRRQVERLLSAHFDTNSLLDAPALGHYSDNAPESSQQPGDTVGPYKLVQVIGEGGMGIVYLAEQQQPVARQVALKIVKPGMDSREILARFDSERQTLAMMDHPHIASIHDAGITSTGRPYFAMELVPGMPITQFCDQHRLTLRERLELLIPVCRAVQHAHQKGVIHRDLKPSNILVSLCDDRMVPKIIDFGVAKATCPHTEQAALTRSGQLVGTIEYMSPEQARLNQLDVDTRSDVYSLGVLMYELLTGETPFDRQRMRGAAFDEVLRMIREEEPPKPSTRLSTSVSLETVAACRRSQPRQLSVHLRGELDWMVMKAMDKDRNRRYETPNQLADDIQRYLHDQALIACPPSRGYRFRKFVKRHRMAVLAVSAVLLVFLAGAVGTTWQALRATAQRDRALSAETRALAEAQLAKAAEQRAVRQAQRADAEAKKARQAEHEARQAAAAAMAAQETTNTIYRYLCHDVLGTMERSPDRDANLRNILEQASLHLVNGRFDQHPILEAAIRHAIGQAYLGLDDLDLAETHLITARRLSRRALGTEHAETLALSNNLAVVRQRQGRYEEAEQLLADVLAVRSHHLGPDHPQTMSTMGNLAAVLLLRKEYVKCESVVQRLLDAQLRTLGAEHASTLVSMNTLAGLRKAQRKYDEAELLLRQVLHVQRSTLGDEHPHTLTTINNLGLVYQALGRNDEARLMLRQALLGRQRVLGEEHPLTALSQKYLAELPP